MKKLSKKSIWLFFFRFLWVGFLIALLVGSFIVSIAAAGGLESTTVYLIILAAVWIIGSYLWSRLYYNCYKFDFSEGVFKKEKGIVLKKYTSIPYKRIQNVDIHRGLLARMLGLSNLMIQTAGSSGGGNVLTGNPEGKLPGLTKERAEEIRKELMKKTSGEEGL